MPKGTILGPLLFSLYINDFMVGIDSDIHLFADDCVCYRQIDSIEHIETPKGYLSTAQTGQKMGYEKSGGGGGGGREKSRECHNHKAQPFPDPKRKRKPTNPNKHKRTKTTEISFLFPKRDNRNTKRTEKHKNKMTHGKTYNKSPRRINHKATKSKTNTGTTALERSVE